MGDGEVWHVVEKPLTEGTQVGRAACCRGAASLVHSGSRFRRCGAMGVCRDASQVGAVAQLGERLVRNEEVSGSIPLSSTNNDICVGQITPEWLMAEGSQGGGFALALSAGRLAR